MLYNITKLVQIYDITAIFNKKIKNSNENIDKWHLKLLILQIHIYTTNETMGKFLNDFKEFAMKGNVVDMAVGVIIGGAFGKIVTSMVNDIIMPLVSLATGSVKISDASYALRPEIKDAAGEVVQAAVTFNYGMFIQNIVDFLIIAFSIFVALRVIMKFKKKEAEAPAPAPAPSKEEQLLTEIRDLLKEQNGKK